MEEKEIKSIEEFARFVKEHADGKTIITVVLELVNDPEGGASCPLNTN